MGADKKLVHIVLQSNRPSELRDWYAKVLDAHVVYQNAVLTFMTFDEEHHRLAIAALPGLTERTPTTVGLSHSAYTYACLADLLAKYEELKDNGIEPLIPVQHGMTTSLYYRDPDGNLVELQIDNFATAAEATDYMYAEEFTTDPVGPTFDPAAMLAALRAGTAESELITRTWAKTSPQLNVLEVVTE
jgi:catechol-2,3-dioxygenase